ncbi:trypsin-like serine protease [Aliivibrio fischeri]|uniref:S1 family peptidase n=1 Tax=Aliivibrio fischeri TaxID=668 RepID=UPI0012D8B68E|nr:serine protease [Aliivibrio fischeri]MUK28545.1 trypsin-like serine protease [Aliivibrio fischeri]
MKIVAGALVALFACSISAEEDSDYTISPYIVGGSDANVADYAFMASLMYEYDNQPGTIYPFCGGSVLDSMHILTAAHCVYDVPNFTVGDMKVVIEANDGQDMLSADKVPVEKIYYPSDYDDDSLLNDVAVLKLSRPLTNYTSGHVAELGDLAEQGYRTADTDFTIVGYGRLGSNQANSNVDFLSATVKYVDPATCDIWSNFTTSNKQVCTTGSSLGNGLVTATCQGDSGGPLVWDNNGVKTQIGIVSFGPGVCGDEALAAQSVFTDVSQYKSWIRQAQNGEIAPTITASSGGGSGGSISFASFVSLVAFGLYRRRKTSF